MKKYYSVYRGHNPGVYLTWSECQRQISGYRGAIFRSFSSIDDARAFSRTGAADVADPKSESEYVLYTDGSAMNGRAGCGIHCARPRLRFCDISAPLTTPPFTNQRAELQAILLATELLDREGVAGTTPVAIFSDSTYSIKAVTVWYKAWRDNGWKTANGKDVLNRDIIEPLVAVLERRTGTRLHWIKGHARVAGNERADILAKAACMEDVVQGE